MASLTPEKYICPFHDELNRFAAEVWGNSQAILKSFRPGLETVEYIDLNIYFPAMQHLFPECLRHDKILVREEYRTTLRRFTNDPQYTPLIYTTGQPGIGKSLFLIYVLIKQLGEKRAVAIQLANGAPFYALFGNTGVSFHNRWSRKPLEEHPGIWALCDFNKYVPFVIPVFITDVRLKNPVIRIIGSSPPMYKYYGSLKEPFWYHIMNIWTKQEVMDLATLLELDGQRMSALAERWGGVPRALLECIHLTDMQVENLYRKSAKEAVRDSYRTDSALGFGMVSGADARINFPKDPLFPFFFILPQMGPKSPGHERRMYPYVCTPTPTLRRFLAEALQGESESVKSDFYSALWSREKTKPTLESIYLSWFHSYASAAQPIPCNWFTERSSSETQLSTEIRGDGSQIISSILDFESFSPPYYWIAPKDFPGVHSALVFKDVIFVFRVALFVPESGMDFIKGMKRLRQVLPYNLENLPWKVVLIGRSKDVSFVRQSAASLSWKRELYGFPERTSVSVGFSVVDPVKEGVVYRVFHDDSECDPFEVDDPGDSSEQMDTD